MTFAEIPYCKSFFPFLTLYSRRFKAQFFKYQGVNLPTVAKIPYLPAFLAEHIVDLKPPFTSRSTYCPDYAIPKYMLLTCRDIWVRIVVLIHVAL